MSPACPVQLPSYLTTPARLCRAAGAHVMLALGLLVVGSLAMADMPLLKPMKGASKTTKLVDTTDAPDAPARPASGASAATPADPLEQLRQRLAGKLSGVKTSAGAAGPLDVRIVAKTSLGPAAAEGPRRTVVGKARAPSAAAASAGVGAHGAEPHWAYQGPAGPQTWGGLRPEFKLCGSGQRQSPIDIRGGLAVDLEPVKFAYQGSRFGVIDNGHTVQANLASGNHIELGGKRFELVQMHFHRPSEERIDGRQFEMSVHLVHKDDQGKLAVVAVLLDKGEAQPAVQQVWNNLPLERHEETAARVMLDPSEILPVDRRYYTYMGSLTTPPCSEGVQWVVMRHPVSVSAEQLELFARIYPMNARPVQQATGRRILQSQ